MGFALECASPEMVGGFALQRFASSTSNQKAQAAWDVEKRKTLSMMGRSVLRLASHCGH